MTNRNFIDDCLCSKATTADINKYIMHWHTNQTGKTLQEFLGMTDAEFTEWGKSSDKTIEKILLCRRKGIAFFTFGERDIIFRGFCADEDGNITITINDEEIKGRWVEGYLLQRNIIVPAPQFITYATNGDKNIITHEHALEFCVVVPETVCQHTGQFGVFEYDLIKHHFGDEIGVVRYGSYRNPFNDDQFTTHVGFYVDWISGKDKNVLRKDLGYWLSVTSVAGNIFENPLTISN